MEDFQDRAGKTDGRLFAVTLEDLVPGTVLRMVDADGNSAPYSDFTVLKVDGPPAEDGPPRGYRDVTLARPYLFASGAGTSCPTALTGVEQVKVSVASLLKGATPFRVVVTSRGQAHGMVT